MSRTKSDDSGAADETATGSGTSETVGGDAASGAGGSSGDDPSQGEAAPLSAKEKRAAAAAEKEASDSAAAAAAADPVIADPGPAPADPWPGEPAVRVDPETAALVSTVPDPTAPAPPPPYARSAFDEFKDRVRKDEDYAMALLWRFEQVALLYGWPELGHLVPGDPVPLKN